MKKSVLIILVLVALCCIVLCGVSWYVLTQLGNATTANVEAERLRLSVMCNDSSLASEIREQACTDYEYTGGCNEKKYAEANLSNTEACTLGLYNVSLLKHNGLLIYSRYYGDGFPSSGGGYFRLLVQYQAKFIGKYDLHGANGLGDGSVAYYAENDNAIWFYPVKYTYGDYFSNQIFVFNKADDSFKYLYAGDPSQLTIIKSQDYDDVSLDIEASTATFLKGTEELFTVKVDNKQYDAQTDVRDVVKEKRVEYLATCEDERQGATTGEDFKAAIKGNYSLLYWCTDQVWHYAIYAGSRTASLEENVLAQSRVTREGVANSGLSIILNFVRSLPAGSTLEVDSSLENSDLPGDAKASLTKVCEDASVKCKLSVENYELPILN